MRRLSRGLAALMVALTATLCFTGTAQAATARTSYVRQRIYYRYQNANGSYGSYSVVYSAAGARGSSGTFQIGDGTTYQVVKTSFTFTGGTTYINVPRKTYRATVVARTGIKSATGSGTYRVGQTVTVKATPASGYTFSYWSGSGVTLKSYRSATTTFVMPARTAYVTAMANASSYSYVVKGRYQNANGSYPSSYGVTIASGKASAGQRVSYSRAANSTYQQVSGSFTMSSGSTTRYVNIPRRTYRVIAQPFTSSGIASVTGGGTYRVGSKVTVTAKVKSGYQFKVWGLSKNGQYRLLDETSATSASNSSGIPNSGIYSTTMTFTMPAYEVLAVAFGEKVTQTYNVWFRGVGGSPVPADTQVAEGQKVSRPSVTPTRAGYDFEGWWIAYPTGAYEPNQNYTPDDGYAYERAWDFDKDVVTHDTLLAARWAKRADLVSYTVYLRTQKADGSFGGYTTYGTFSGVAGSKQTHDISLTSIALEGQPTFMPVDITVTATAGAQYYVSLYKTNGRPFNGGETGFYREFPTVTLSGTAGTPYGWRYRISDSSALRLVSSAPIPRYTSTGESIAGGTEQTVYTFAALKGGQSNAQVDFTWDYLWGVDPAGGAYNRTCSYDMHFYNGLLTAVVFSGDRVGANAFDLQTAL